MKGIILAGGAGTRLYPLTIPISKQLMPVYDKPMIYYPLSVLMLTGIKEILIISQADQLPLYQRLFGDGQLYGLKIKYAEQSEPKGLADAFLVGERFIDNDSVALILGDNIFYGTDLQQTVQSARSQVETNGGGMVFAYHVSDPERYGVVSFDVDGKATSIVEKPQKPESHFAVPGLYFYDKNVVNVAKYLRPSDRGELEITDVNKSYLAAGKLNVSILSRGTAWLDTGTHESLLAAANFVQIIEQRQGLKIGAIEEIAFRLGYINREQLLELAETLQKSGYGAYLKEVAMADKLGPGIKDA